MNDNNEYKFGCKEERSSGDIHVGVSTSLGFQKTFSHISNILSASTGCLWIKNKTCVNKKNGWLVIREAQDLEQLAAQQAKREKFMMKKSSV